MNSDRMRRAVLWIEATQWTIWPDSSCSTWRWEHTVFSFELQRNRTLIHLNFHYFSLNYQTLFGSLTHILNFKSSRSKDVRQNFALGILNHGRVQFGFLCSVLFYQRATLWSTLWSRLWNSEPFKCCLWNTLPLLGKLGQAELMSLLDRIS